MCYVGAMLLRPPEGSSRRGSQDTPRGSACRTTPKGRGIWRFAVDARTEVRKVVWPTRQETLQTTLIVIVMVIIVAIILWLLDIFLGWSIRSLMGQGG